MGDGHSHFGRDLKAGSGVGAAFWGSQGGSAGPGWRLVAREASGGLVEGGQPVGWVRRAYLAFSGWSQGGSRTKIWQAVHYY